VFAQQIFVYHAGNAPAPLPDYAVIVGAGDRHPFADAICKRFGAIADIRRPAIFDCAGCDNQSDPPSSWFRRVRANRPRIVN